jgi:peptidoglycan-associated lipoprotein
LHPFEDMKLATSVCCLLAAALLAGCGTADPRVGRQVAVIAPPTDLPPEPPPLSTAEPAPAPVPVPVVDAVPTPVPVPASPPSSPPEPPPAAPAAAAVPVETATPVPVPVPVAAQRPQRADVIYFKPDAYKVDARYRRALQAHARRLKADPQLRMVIQAHADSSGDREYNLALSKKRAETVAKQLKALGVPARQLELVYHGEAAGERVAAAERRVELLYRVR